MIKGLILSFQFFTSIPINIPVDFNKKNIRYSILFLPLIGFVIGGMGGFIYYLLFPYSRLIASFLTLLITILSTGGLHIDGLSDTFDGFMAGKDRERTLEIMQDSRIGAFGVLSIFLLLICKLVLIISIENLPMALALSMANSRLVLGIIISYRKPAKTEGLGKLFHSSKPKALIVMGSIIYLLILLLIDIRYIIPLIINLVVAQYISHISYRKVNGLTGDVYGAIIEIGDVVSLLCFWGVMIWI